MPHPSIPSTPRKASKSPAAYDSRDHDYVRSYDRRSNERHHRSEGGDYDQTLDQAHTDPIARSGDLSGQ